MSRIVVILVVILIALAASEFAPAVATSERATAAPSLRLVRSQPITVAGRAFKSRERLRVTVAHGDQIFVRALRASLVGGFVVSFAELSFQRCEGFFARASGARGSRAILKIFPPACLTD